MAVIFMVVGGMVVVFPIIIIMVITLVIITAVDGGLDMDIGQVTSQEALLVTTIILSAVLKNGYAIINIDVTGSADVIVYTFGD